jgi:hypothetical protein
VSTLTKWRGLAALMVDAVTHGSHAIERIQKETADRPFTLLEQIPKIAPATRVAHMAFDTSVASVHLAIRLVARGVGGAVDLGLGLAEASKHADDPPTQVPGGRPPP